MSSEVKLDKRISFVSDTVMYDKDGFPIKIEEVYYACWSNIKRLSFKEFYGSKTDNSILVDSFRVRKCRIVDLMDSKQYKIRYENKLYKIIYMNPDPENDGMYIDFKGEVIE